MLSQKIDGKRLLLTGLLLVLLFSCARVKADASWVRNTDGTYSWYNSKGKLVKNKWIQSVYYVDENGIRVTGHQKIGNKYYFFNKKTGELIKGTWIKSGSKYFYAKSNGVLYRKGRYKINGYYYYFNRTGRCLTGLREVSGKYCYFDVNTRRMAVKAWVKIDGKYYYFNKNGFMKKNKWVGKRYVGSDGAALSGLQQISGKYYYFDTSTLKKVTSTTKTVNGVTYEFDSSGVGTVKTTTTTTSTSTSTSTTSGSRSKSSYSVESTYYSDPCVSDEVLLGAIIYCEAGNQGYEGQLAVGMVIVNRLRSSQFPNSFAEVIYQKQQFEPARTGSLTSTLKNQSKITSTCKQAASEAIKRYKNGTTTCTISGKEVSFPYLFFMTKSAYKRLGLKTSVTTIGDHVFFTNWY